MARNSWRLISITTTLVMLTSAPNLHAYCRTMTCELGQAPTEYCPLDDGCERDAHCCATVGLPLHWSSPCLDFSVQLDGSVLLGLEADEVMEVVQAAFQRWQTAACPEGGTPGFAARFAGFVSCDSVQTVCARAPRNVRLVVARDGTWPHRDRELAVTKPAAEYETGEIVDADLEFNTHPPLLGLSGEPGTVGFEALENIITHEIGHFLGLAHSDDANALMYYAYQSSRASSDLLGADDIAGICASYPPLGAPLDCGQNPGPAYDECRVPAADGSDEERGCIAVQDAAEVKVRKEGCAVATLTPEPAGQTWLFGLGLFAMLGWRRRSQSLNPASAQRSAATPRSIAGKAAKG